MTPTRLRVAMADMVRYQRQPGESSPAQVGDPAPEFSLVSLDGTELKLSALRGQVVVLDLMALWCDTCLTELDVLRRLRPAAFKGKSG